MKTAQVRSNMLIELDCEASNSNHQRQYLPRPCEASGELTQAFSALASASKSGGVIGIDVPRRRVDNSAKRPTQRESVRTYHGFTFLETFLFLSSLYAVGWPRTIIPKCTIFRAVGT